MSKKSFNARRYTQSKNFRLSDHLQYKTNSPTIKKQMGYLETQLNSGAYPFIPLIKNLGGTD